MRNRKNPINNSLTVKLKGETLRQLYYLAQGERLALATYTRLIIIDRINFEIEAGNPALTKPVEIGFEKENKPLT